MHDTMVLLAYYACHYRMNALFSFTSRDTLHDYFGRPLGYAGLVCSRTKGLKDEGLNAASRAQLPGVNKSIDRLCET
jgi:hypothetical protein